MYYIWNPYLVPDHHKSLEFVLTRGDSNQIAKGTKEFIENILKDIGVNERVAKWSIYPCRSKYYSEYLGEDDWRDNWQIVWKVHVITTTNIGELPKIKEDAIGTDATDDSWSTKNVLDDTDKVACLVIADFDNEAALKKAQDTISGNDLKEMRKRYSAGKPTFSRSVVSGKYHQLQINLGRFPGDFFAKGADYAERVIELCKNAEGTVHFEDRKTK
jgi:hypothetical protein